MKKVVLIVPYFGSLPNYFDLFLKSCAYNPEVDWLFVTDAPIQSPYKNIHVLPWTFEQMKQQISETLAVREPIPAPYKLCDYRPAYGEIFADYIREYDFWGHCDLDLIYGDVSSYIHSAPLEEYDRIFTFGHLTLYRNSERVNRYYRLEGEKDTDFYYCIRFPEPMYFDEVGMNLLLEQHQIPQHHDPDFADIWPQKAGFKNRIFSQDKNHKKQFFTWEDGKVFKNWQEKGEKRKQEYSYIHLQKRSFPQPAAELMEKEKFAITPHGFCLLDDPALPQKNRPNYRHAFHYYKNRYSKMTLKKVKRKLQLLLVSKSLAFTHNNKEDMKNGNQRPVG